MLGIHELEKVADPAWVAYSWKEKNSTYIALWIHDNSSNG